MDLKNLLENTRRRWVQDLKKYGYAVTRGPWRVYATVMNAPYIVLPFEELNQYSITQPEMGNVRLLEGNAVMVMLDGLTNDTLAHNGIVKQGINDSWVMTPVNLYGAVHGRA